MDSERLKIWIKASRAPCEHELYDIFWFDASKYSTFSRWDFLLYFRFLFWFSSHISVLKKDFEMKANTEAWCFQCKASSRNVSFTEKKCFEICGPAPDPLKTKGDIHTYFACPVFKPMGFIALLSILKRVNCTFFKWSVCLSNPEKCELKRQNIKRKIGDNCLLQPNIAIQQERYELRGQSSVFGQSQQQVLFSFPEKGALSHFFQFGSLPRQWAEFFFCETQNKWCFAQEKFCTTNCVLETFFWR